MVEQYKLSLTPFHFVSHVTRNGGFLPDEPGAHACWYYCRCAILMWKAVVDGADYEGELDHIDMQNNIARGIATLYSLESPSDFLKFMDYVKLEAIRLDLEWNVKIENPGASTHVRSN